MNIPEERIGLHFAMMMLGMAWEVVSDRHINSSEEDDEKAYAYFKRYDDAQTKLWLELSTEEREFYNRVARHARWGEDGPPHCERCGEEYMMETGHEPTRYCDRCAHIVVEELAEKLRVSQAQVDEGIVHIEDIYSQYKGSHLIENAHPGSQLWCWREGLKLLRLAARKDGGG